MESSVLVDEHATIEHNPENRISDIRRDKVSDSQKDIAIDFLVHVEDDRLSLFDFWE